MSNINYSSIKKLSEYTLKTFADLIYQRMNGVAVYAPFQSFMEDLRQRTLIYQEALANAMEGGRDRVRVKNEAKTELITQLNKTGKLMDATWLTDEHDIDKANAGFELVKKPVHHVVTEVEAPTNLIVENMPRSGSVLVRWDKMPNVIMYAFEVLQPDGSWLNGRYNQKSVMEISDLTPGEKFVIKSRSLGPDSITSPWTEPVSVFVS
jgi:hypothetical protein